MSEIEWLMEKNERLMLRHQIAQAYANEPQYIHALMAAYRKHHLDDAGIGADELADILADALSEAMGATNFVLWVQEQTGDPGEGPDYVL